MLPHDLLGVLRVVAAKTEAERVRLRPNWRRSGRRELSRQLGWELWILGELRKGIVSARRVAFGRTDPGQSVAGLPAVGTILSRRVGLMLLLIRV